MARKTVSYCGIKYHISCRYPNGNNLLIELWDNKGNRDILTKMFIKTDDKTISFVDTNNHPTAEEFIERYGLGKPTGKYVRSGFCMYPEYVFDLDKLNEYA